MSTLEELFGCYLTFRSETKIDADRFDEVMIKNFPVKLWAAFHCNPFLGKVGLVSYSASKIINDWCQTEMKFESSQVDFTPVQLAICNGYVPNYVGFHYNVEREIVDNELIISCLPYDGYRVFPPEFDIIQVDHEVHIPFKSIAALSEWIVNPFPIPKPCERVSRLKFLLLTTGNNGTSFRELLPQFESLREHIYREPGSNYYQFNNLLELYDMLYLKHNV